MPDFQQIGDTMGGVGAALTGNLGIYQRNRTYDAESKARVDMAGKKQMDEFEKERKRTYFLDADEAHRLLQANDLEGASRVFQDRIQQLPALGGTTKESEWALLKIHSAMNGDEAALALVTKNLGITAEMGRENGLLGRGDTSGQRDLEYTLSMLPEDKRQAAIDYHAGISSRPAGDKIVMVGDVPMVWDAPSRSLVPAKIGGQTIDANAVGTSKGTVAELAAGGATRGANEEDLVSKPPVARAVATAGVLGSAEGDAQVALPAALANSEYMLATIDAAINHPGLGVGTGMSSKIDPRNIMPGSDAFAFGLIDDQIQGQTFMQAYQSLKGGGTITEIESEKATIALQRMKRSQSKEEYVKAANEFKQVITDSMDRARGATSVGGQPQGALPKGTADNGDGTFTLPNGMIVRKAR